MKKSPYWTQMCHFIGQPSLKTHNKQDGNQSRMPRSLLIKKKMKASATAEVSLGTTLLHNSIAVT